MESHLSQQYYQISYMDNQLYLFSLSLVVNYQRNVVYLYSDGSFIIPDEHFYAYHRPCWG